MDDNKLRFGVGVLVIAAIGIGIILTFLFGAFPTVLSDEYAVAIHFKNAAGLSANTKVLRDGVPIGRVTDIQLVTDPDKGGVNVYVAIEGQYKLSHRYVPRIGIGSVITGDATLEFARVDDAYLRREYEGRLDPAFIESDYYDGEYVTVSDKSEDPFKVIFGLEEDVRNTLQSIQRAGESISQTGQNFNQLVGDARDAVGTTDEKIDAVADEAVETLKRLQEAIIEVKDLVGDPQLKDSLQASFDQLPEVLKEAQGTFESFEKVGQRFESVGREAEALVKDVRPIIKNVDRTVDTARQTVQDAGKTLDTIDSTFQSAERTIQNIEKFSEPLAENGDQLVTQVLRSLQSVDRALAQVETFGSSLNNNNGTVKRLLEDDEIYWQIRRTIENVEQASARIKPILDDARIFSDKIARDPRQLGIRGAVTRRPNGMGLK